MHAINENSHPNLGSPGDKQRRRYDASEASQHFKDGVFVDSLDAAEVDLGRQPVSEVSKSAGAKHAQARLFVIWRCFVIQNASPSHQLVQTKHECCVLSETIDFTHWLFGSSLQTHCCTLVACSLVQHYTGLELSGSQAWSWDRASAAATC